MIRVTLAIVLLTTWCFGQADDGNRGRDIAAEAARRDQGFLDSTATVAMTLLSADGKTRSRLLTWKVLERRTPYDGDRSLTLFHEPRDIAGTAFLSVTRVSGEDEQWLYLPSLKRSKRIPAANKTSAFVGSEFTYEDLLSEEVERYQYRWLREEPCNKWRCQVIERRPLDENSGYQLQTVWIDDSHYRTTKIEFTDRNGEHIKTLFLSDFKLYRDRYWRPLSLQMINHRNNRETLLRFKDFVFQTGLLEQDFTPARLRHIRE